MLPWQNIHLVVNEPKTVPYNSTALIIRQCWIRERSPAHFRPFGFEGNTMLKLIDNLLSQQILAGKS